MKRSRFGGIILILGLLALLATSCVSSRPPYHRYYKLKKPPKCDCSKWSQLNQDSFYHLPNNEERPSGRA